MKGITFFLALVVAACDGDRDLLATGSQTLVTSGDRRSVYVLNAEDGSMSAVEIDGAVTEIALGVDPARIARSRDRVYVTLAGEGTVVALAETGDGLVVTDRHAVGSEPVGIVASRDGRFVYVALTLEDRVEERDAETFERIRGWDVPNQPRWLAVHPSGRSLFVASALRGTVSRIDLEAGVRHVIDLPRTTRDREVVLVPRLTGDPAITPDGTAIAFPALYVDDETPVDPLGGSGDGSGYASSGGQVLGVSRMNPALVTFFLDKDGEIVPGTGAALFAGARDRGGDIVRSMPTSVVSSPDGSAWLVALEGSSAVLLVHRGPVSSDAPAGAAGSADGAATEYSHGTTSSTTGETSTADLAVDGFVEEVILVQESGVGPRGFAFTDDETGWVHGWLSRDLRMLDFTAAREALALEAAGEGRAPPWPGPARSIAASTLPADVERGRLLFNSAIDPRMVVEGGGVSCATCHLGGRSDGMVWPLEGGLRNTLSLVGGIRDTDPFTWGDDVASIGLEAALTSQVLMGGEGLTTADRGDLTAYVDWMRRVDAPRAAASLLSLGEEVFNRGDVGCATCHLGDLFTDDLAHEIIGLAVQTPILRGVAASAPYFHDGSAPDLRAVLEFARGGAMGNTGGLTETEMDALEAYVRSL